MSQITKIYNARNRPRTLTIIHHTSGVYALTRGEQNKWIHEGSRYVKPVPARW